MVILNSILNNLNKRLLPLLLCVSMCYLPVAYTTEITIVYSGSLSEIDTPKYGDYGELSTLLKKTKKQNPNTLFLFGGASFSPSYLSSFDHGAHIVDLLNSLSPHAMAITKRELSYTEDELAQRSQEAAFPMLLTNVYDPLTKGTIDGTYENLILDVDGVKVGIISVLHESVSTLYLLERIQILDPKVAIVDNVKKLKQQGADIVILLYTNDYFPFLYDLLDSDLIDLALNTDPYLASRTRKTGHEKDIVLDEFGSAAVINLTVSNSKKITNREHRLIALNTLAKDQTILSQINNYKNRLNKILDEKVASINGVLNTRSKRLRTSENEFGNIVADALKQVANSDIALINSGAIRGDRRYPQDYSLSRKDISAELPYRSRISVVKLTGQQIIDVLEHSVSRVEIISGRFLQVSGLEFTFDKNEPVGHRIKKVLINKNQLDESKLYTVAVSDYLSNGGDGFTSFQNAEKVQFSLQVNPLVKDIVVNYMRNKKHFNASLAGRIIELSNTPEFR